MNLSYPDGSKIESEGLQCIPLKPSEESAKALSTSNDQIPWANLERFPQTLAAAVPFHTISHKSSASRRESLKLGHPLTLENETTA